MTTTIKLRKPIQAHGQTLTELTLRKPIGKEIRVAGMPYVLMNVGEEGGIRISGESCARLISMVAQIPTSSVDQLDADDFNDAAMGIISFFVDAEKVKKEEDRLSTGKSSSGDTSTSPTSGAI